MICVLALVMALGVGVATFADATVTNSWYMDSGSMQIDATTNVGPSNFPGSINPVTTTVNVDGISQGTLTSQVKTTPVNPYYGTFNLDNQTLDAAGYNQAQAIRFRHNANDDVHGLNPTNGFLVDTSVAGNYDVSIRTKNDTFDVESALDATIIIPGGGGVANVLFNQSGSTITHTAQVALATNDAGIVTMVKPTSYCQYLSNTLMGDVAASGSGSSYIGAGTNNPVGMDFNAKGTTDTTHNQEVDADNVVGSITHQVTFANNVNYVDTVPLNLQSGAGTGAYWPSLPQHTSVGYLIDFRGTNNLPE
jgi:hypothetical protein